MSDSSPALFPVFLNIAEIPVLIAGGGRVGARRARALVEAGARRVKVVSPRFDASMPAGVERVVERFRVEHLDGQRLVFAATDSEAVNRQVQEAAAARGLLCGRADAGEAGDFITPSTWRQGRIVAAVSAGSPTLSRKVGEAMSAAAADWGELAEAVSALRPVILREPDRAICKAAMEDLASIEARDVLRFEGTDGLRRWLVNRHPSLCAVLQENQQASEPAR